MIVNSLVDAIKKHTPFLDCGDTEKYLELVSVSSQSKGEKHHILPKSIFPEFTKCKWNIVNLDYKDHYIAHHLLMSICKNENHTQKMIQAWVMMNKSKGDPDYAEEYEIAKIQQRENMLGEGNHMYGKSHTEEVKKYISIKNSGRIASEDTRRLMSITKMGDKNHMYGNTHSEESRKKISIAATGRIHSEESLIKISNATKGENNGMFGRNHKESSKQLMSESKAIYEHDGKLWSLNKLAKEFDITREGLQYRLDAGMQLEDALTFTIQKGGILINKLLDRGFKFNNGIWYNKDSDVINTMDRVIVNYPKGSDHKTSVLTEEKVRQIKNLLKNKVTQKEIAYMFDVSISCIKHISKGRSWSHVIIDHPKDC